MRPNVLGTLVWTLSFALPGFAAEAVSQVMVNGRLYEAATMTEVGSSRKREAFYWQR